MVSVRTALLVISTLGASYYFVIHPFLFPAKDKPSQLLLEVVHYLDFVKEFNEQTIQMLNEDPFGDLVNEVRPTLDEMGSIKAQLSKYEKMDLEQAPELFIKTASERNERVQEKIFVFERKYRLLLDKMNRKCRVLMEQQMPRFTNDMLRVMDTVARQLGDYKLYIRPDDDDKSPKTTDIDFIKSILVKLSRYYAEVEKLYPNHNILKVFTQNPDLPILQSKGVTNETEAILERMKKFMDLSGTIMAIAKEHGDSTLHGASPYVLGVNDQLHDRLPKVMDSYARCKERYEKLVDGIDSDVTTTRERIRSLGKGTGKKVDEL